MLPGESGKSETQRKTTILEAICWIKRWIKAEFSFGFVRLNTLRKSTDET